MTSNELTLDLALEAFWAKVAELHPERESGDLPPTEVYDLENYARNAVGAWLEINKPVVYVQRTVAQVLRIVGELNPEDAVAKAAEIPDPDWFNESLDTNYEYIVLGPNGKALT